MTDGGIQVKRWSKFGHQRLYVSGPQGESLGWYDLRTGEEHLERAEDAVAFRTALAPHLGPAQARAGSAPPASASPTSGSPADPPPAETVMMPPSLSAAARARAAGQTAAVPLARPVVDLAGRRAGQSARDQAELAAAIEREKGRLRFAVARFRDDKTEERSWRVGADGEEAVGSRLDKLRKHGWFTLHALPIGEHGSDIDHVLIGPGGVFCLNTKTHPGKKVWVRGSSIRINGHPEHYVRNSRFEGRRVTSLLMSAAGVPVFVQPILVFAGAELDVKQQPEGVIVIGSRSVAAWLARRPLVLSPEQLAHIYGVARLSSTWEQTSAPAPNAKPLPLPVLPAGQWAPDPYGRAELRYFDGTSWTAHVSSGGVLSTEGA